MKPIRDAWLIQIEVTNACHRCCSNCTRFVGHYQKPFFMDLATVERAIDSLEGFPGGIGIMGGEPTLHPHFVEICDLVRKKIPRKKRGLWTSGYKWKEYQPVIRETFESKVFYNDHTGKDQAHQPMLIAIDDVVEDKPFMWQLIDRCWIQEKWSAAVNPKGGFFCEVAAAMDMLFAGEGGYPLEKGWWDKTPVQFQDQVRRYCPGCSGALPLPRISNQKNQDTVSKSNYERLRALGSPRLAQKGVEIFGQKIPRAEIESVAKNWKPWEYLGEDGKRSSRKLYAGVEYMDSPSLYLQLKRKMLQVAHKLKKTFS
ncbi:radical SAM protein [candidate division FCPU426 bacterium]|nr:radical SAM protein [candidate division FCPU426 bacterium]